ncbi:MAG: M4 family metallopeptidase [Micrococcales bacterium]|nr:M4 family metallopeptidase [Micrococcales bacterium]
MTRSRLRGASLAVGALAAATLTTALPAVSAPTTDTTAAAASTTPSERAAKAADDFVAGRGKSALHKAGKDAFSRTRVHAGSDGTHYVAYERTHGGIPVRGGDFVIATNGQGKVTGETSSLDRAISVETNAKVSAGAARKAAASRVSSVSSTSTPVLVVLAEDEATPRLAWETVVRGTHQGKQTILTVHTDARTGAYIDSWDLVRDAADDRGYHQGTVDIDTQATSMTDPTRSGFKCGGQDGSAFTGSDSAWGNGSASDRETACVDAMVAAQAQWDMLDEWLGRKGIKGDGTGYPMRVGLNEVNAFWNGSYTNFGHSSDNQRNLVETDVVAHEQGHGIFYTTPGGSAGDDETGGMNEATGDIFGAATEHFMNNASNPPDYTVGEESNLTGDGPIRVMYNPSVLGNPNCYSSSIKNTEVHAAAGPLNHWFYLLAEGSNPAGKQSSPICSGGPSSVTGVGIKDATKIFYNGLLGKTSYWTHPKARVATLTAVKNLYPTDCAKYDAVKNAWNAVSVPAQSGEPARPSTCGGTPEEPGPTEPTPQPGGSCDDASQSAYVSSGRSAYLPSSSGFSSAAGEITGCLDGPSGADFDLYLQRWNGSSWVDVASGETSGADESVKFSATAGTYRWDVYAYSGSGTAALKWGKP